MVQVGIVPQKGQRTAQRPVIGNINYFFCTFSVMELYSSRERKMAGSDQHISQSLSSWESLTYPFTRRLGGPLRRSVRIGEEKDILPWSGIKTCFLGRSSPHTDWTIPALAARPCGIFVTTLIHLFAQGIPLTWFTWGGTSCTWKFCPILYVETLRVEISMKKLCDCQYYFRMRNTKPLKEKNTSANSLAYKKFFNNIWNTGLRISENAASFELSSFIWKNDILHQALLLSRVKLMINFGKVIHCNVDSFAFYKCNLLPQTYDYFLHP